MQELCLGMKRKGRECEANRRQSEENDLAGRSQKVRDKSTSPVGRCKKSNREGGGGLSVTKL